MIVLVTGQQESGSSSSLTTQEVRSVMHIQQCSVRPCHGLRLECSWSCGSGGLCIVLWAVLLSWVSPIGWKIVSRGLGMAFFLPAHTSRESLPRHVAVVFALLAPHVWPELPRALSSWYQGCLALESVEAPQPG